MNKCQLLLSSLLVACLLVACGGNRQPQEPASLMEASRQELATVELCEKLTANAKAHRQSATAKYNSASYDECY